MKQGLSSQDQHKGIQTANVEGALYWLFGFSKGNDDIIGRLAQLLDRYGVLPEELQHHADVIAAIVRNLANHGDHKYYSGQKVSDFMKDVQDRLLKLRDKEFDETKCLFELLTLMIERDKVHSKCVESERIKSLVRKTSVCVCVLLGKMPHSSYDFLVPKLRAVLADLQDDSFRTLQELVTAHNASENNAHIDLNTIVCEGITNGAVADSTVSQSPGTVR